MIFLTGFPGFLGTRLVRRLADDDPDVAFVLLVQDKFEERARRTVADLGLADRAEVVVGDITLPDLGLADQRLALARRVTRAFHLAAVYDLAIPYDVAWRINVEGTRHVLDFLEDCPELGVFGYVSTAYVSGRRTGAVREDELAHEAGFKNHYEETKYHAEVLVQERMDRLPAVVFRPAIVVGDSETGETDKFDGPYHVLRVLRHLPSLTLMTRVGSGHNPVNLVPVDYVVRAMAYLARPAYAGSVFHLTDPSPLTTQEVMELFLQRLEKQALFVPVPPLVARTLVGTPAGRALGLTPQLVDYFDFPAFYDSRETERALAGSGIRCPPLPVYVGQMVRYVEQHADTRSEAMY